MADDETTEEPAAEAADQPTAETPAAETKVVKAKASEAKPAARPGGTLAGAGAGGHGVVVVGERKPVATLPALPGMPPMTRRGVLQIAFWTGLGAMLLGIVATLLNSIYPRKITGFGGKVFVGTVDQLAQKGVLHNLEAKAWIMRLDATQAARETKAAAAAGLGYEVKEGAIVALYHKCPHLGCTVPFRPEFAYEDPRIGEAYKGWFRCPCHGSTYSAGGVRVFGPAPRSLDTFALTIEGGRITVDTGSITKGDPSDPSRAILPG